jgi:hypothetical protein
VPGWSRGPQILGLTCPAKRCIPLGHYDEGGPG